MHLALCRNVASTGMAEREMLGTEGVERGKKRRGTMWRKWVSLCSLDFIPTHPHWSVLFCFFNAIYIQYTLLLISRNPKINELLVTGFVLAKLTSMGRQPPNSRSRLLSLPPTAIASLEIIVHLFLLTPLGILFHLSTHCYRLQEGEYGFLSSFFLTQVKVCCFICLIIA